MGGALIGAGLVIAAVIIADSFGRAKVSRPETAPVVAEFDTVRLPIPSEFVPTGTRVKDISFKTVAFPRHQVPPGALSSLEGFEEALTVAPLPANLPLFAQNLSKLAGPSNPVTERIAPGMRAMTVRVDETSSVEGWAGSGSVVDVLLVQGDRTMVVAEKVRVISAERSVSPVDGQKAPHVPSTVTLLVSQEQCLAINTAIPMGRLAFALRSAKDDQDWTQTVFTADRLKGHQVAQGPAPAAISGFVSVKNDKRSNFALSNGKWIHADTVPDGFLTARQPE
jgi:pilus assembly protein CpaB